MSPHHDDTQWGPSDELGRMISQKPYIDPPPGLTNKIVMSLRPKRVGWMRRLYLLMTTPMQMFASPLTVTACAAVLMVSGGMLFRASVPDHPLPVSATLQHSGRVPVLFRFQSPQAQSVSVIGTFNHWNPKGYEMVQDPETGDWTLKTELRPGKHDYVFLVNDKEFAADPDAVISKADDYGYQNSILFIKGPNGQKI